jgi:hypothetical protein
VRPWKLSACSTEARTEQERRPARAEIGGVPSSRSLRLVDASE